MSLPSYLLGVDIGGTKVAISIAKFSPNTMQKPVLITSSRVPGGSFAPPQETFNAIIQETERLMADLDLNGDDFAAIGLGAPGSIDLNTGIMASSPNMPGWTDVDLRAPLQLHFNCPVFVENDANGGVLAEAIFGSAQGFRDILYLTMSTGIGGGVIASGRLIHGKGGLAGELGHLTLNPAGPRCGCGLNGCFEAYCGGKNTEKRLKAIATEHPTHPMMKWPMVEGDIEKLGVPALLDALRKEDPTAQEIWQDYIEHLAHGVGLCLTALNPEVIVFGTIAHHAGPLFFKPLNEAVTKYTWAEMRDQCIFKTSELGTHIGELAGVATALYHLKGELPS